MHKTQEMHITGRSAARVITIAEQIMVERRVRRARLRSLWELTPSERVTAMRCGELTLEQCAAWAALYPEQVPLIDGEFEYLVAFTPEVCE